MSAKTSFWHLELSPCYMVDNFIQCFIRQVLQAQHCLLILLMFLYFFISLFQYPNTYGFWHSGDWWHFSSFPASFCHSLYWSVHFFLIKHTYYMHLPSSTFACKCRTSMVYLFFRSAPSTFPRVRGYLLGAFFRESLVITLYSEIGQIHLSIEAQCGSPVYLWVTTTQGTTILNWLVHETMGHDKWPCVG